MSLIFVVAGLLILGAGADRMVIGACAIARRTNLPESLIGATVVAGGTSLPELIASIQATYQGHYGLAIGNVIGSNVVNVALGIGVVAVVTPLAISRTVTLFDWPFMAAVSVVLGVVVFIFPYLPVFMAVLFLLAWLIYVLFSIRLGYGTIQADLHPSPILPLWLSLTWLFLGLVLLSGGGWLLVKGAVHIAELMGISEVVIGLTVIAIGTSAPEIANSLIAALRGKVQLAIGNVIGSNTFNILLILGIIGLSGQVRIDEEIRNRDVWWLMIFSLSLPLLWGFGKRQINRFGGITLLLMFFIYSLIIYYQITSK